MRAAMLAPLAYLLVLLGSAVDTEQQPGLLLGLAAVLVAVTLGAAGHVLSTASAPACAVAERARRRALDQGGPPRQRDPDAAGHARPRAPSRPPATVAPS